MTFVKYLKVNRSAPLFMLAWQAGFLAFGMIIVLVINTFLNDEPDYACMGSLFALIATAVGVLARGNQNGSTRFQVALAMGQTRRSYLLCDSAISLVVSAIGLTAAWCAYQLENGLYTLLYPGFENDIPLDGIYQLKYILPILAVLVLLDLFFTAIILRFGAKAFRVVWLCFCFSFMLIPRTIDAHIEGSTSLFARVGGVLIAVAKALPIKAWIGVGVAFLLALLIFAINIFRKAEVKL